MFVSIEGSTSLIGLSAVLNMNGAISNEVMRGFEDMDWSILEVISLYELDNSLHAREPCRDSFMTGPRWVAELLNGNTNRIYESLGMERHVFINLCNLMKHRGWLQDSRYVRVDEQLAMFVQALQGSCSTRRRCERFQHSGETVSKFFKIVLKAFLNLAKENIHAPNMNVEQPQIRNNQRHHPYFRVNGFFLIFFHFTLLHIYIYLCKFLSSL